MGHQMQGLNLGQSGNTLKQLPFLTNLHFHNPFHAPFGHIAAAHLIAAAELANTLCNMQELLSVVML